MIDHEGRQTRFVMTAATGSDLNFKPSDGMRSLFDVMNHLAEIPTIDLQFCSMQFNNFEEVHAMEKELRRNTIDELLALYDEGMEAIHEFISKLSDDQLTENSLKPFDLEGPPRSWAHYIPEITTHLAMHKMQLWMYLRLAGAPVNMRTYYGVRQND
ncbi:MAG: DinB family protein [Candidatus Thorarchaeota archaeon]|nr:DinB family protein [Candidatus Thorarchaeota archaeon]